MHPNDGRVVSNFIVQALRGDNITIYGDGQQTRSFLYIDECVESTCRLMNSEFIGPVNIGSEEMIKINDLARMTIEIAGKNLHLNNISGPLGVRGRNSDNKLYKSKIGWVPSQSLRSGMEKTYAWIEKQTKLNTVMSTADLDMRDRFYA
jgi:nucleoside-diphosphate-sugar epimerase